MNQPLLATERVKQFGVSLIFSASFILILGAGFAVSADAQTAPPGPSPSRQAIEVRKAVFTLIANNFKPVGEVLQGKAQYDAAEIQKRTARVAFLSELVGEGFPDASNTGLPDTKAKAEIWTDRASFDKKVKEFREHAATLAQVSAKETTASDAFKAAAAAVGQDCKGCHEAFKVK
ncbi:MAG: cytochrome c prime [Verrucomicrobiaceae bacterium]|nr:cytochrome c prime [Verrucomicrobiaceae bacterium]